jgi:hypothetical protein
MNIDLYEVRLRKDHRGVDVSSDALPFGRLWYGDPDAFRNIRSARKTSNLTPSFVGIAEGNCQKSNSRPAKFRASRQ